MAVRPIFVPVRETRPGVEEKSLEFEWFPGMSESQKRKSIKSLHETARKNGFDNVLEISSKSENDLGIALSAFNMMITTKLKNKSFSVECAFQAGKIFENGGPYVDLLDKSSREAKKDIRLKESGNLIAFRFYNQKFPLTPRTYFYDWLYVNALSCNEDLSNSVLSYDGFSDIEFNPTKSINCQAYSAALFVSLVSNNSLTTALESPKAFLEVLHEEYKSRDKRIVLQKKLL